MKLIDLLVQELPKRGGWPMRVLTVTQDSDGQVNSYKINEPTIASETWCHNGFIGYLFDDECMKLCDDWHTSIITREQYETAIVAW